VAKRERSNKDHTSLNSLLPSLCLRARQSRRLPHRAFVAALTLPLLLNACGGPGGGIRIGGKPEGITSGVIAEEPKAALIGRDVLQAGGTAADAAAATYLALSVTMPATAGLGGGGVCIYWDPTKGQSEVIDFLPHSTAGGRMSIPSNLRGMALLQARHGKVRWELLIPPAETLARFSTPVSRALAQDLAAPGATSNFDLNGRLTYTTVRGGGLTEGMPLRQPDIATTLARLRTAGVGDFYSGQFARQLVQSAAEGGGDLTMEDLRDRIPEVKQPLSVPIGNHKALFPPPPAAGGAVAADLLAMLNYAGYGSADQQERPHILVEALRRAMAGEAARLAGEAGEIGTKARAAALMADFKPGQATNVTWPALPDAMGPPATSFAALDNTGAAVSCAVTLGARFGLGTQAVGTGIFLATPTPRGGTLALAPTLVVNTNNNRTIELVTASGGKAAPAVAVETIATTVIEDLPLDDALNRPRLSDEAGVVQLEAEGGDSGQALARAGHKIRSLETVGRASAIYCPAGVPEGRGGCELKSDPRGAGLAVAN
jgi:gamma-glutamyltranspeptidase/glutathione hydrolase